MHELSLVQGMMGQLMDLAARNSANRIVRVVVEVGPFSGVVVDSFIFAFDALKSEHRITKNSVLEIETPVPVMECPECGFSCEIKHHEQDEQELSPFSALGFWGARTCPHCKDVTMITKGGDELLLKQVEME